MTNPVFGLELWAEAEVTPAAVDAVEQEEE